MSSDNFSAQAAEYAQYRPHYPDALFDALAHVAPAQHLAWDCATGSGQSAVPLARRFERVIATDISASQIAHAARDEGVEYRVAPAESSGIEPWSVDLVTVSQALHWFELDGFYDEVRRVTVNDGVLAVSSYDSASLDDDELSRILSRFEHEKLGAYWPPRRELVGRALLGMPFPFDEIEMPQFDLRASWSLLQLVGYTRSWSATAAYVRRHAEDPTCGFERELRASWGDPNVRREVSWPFVLRAGRVTH